MTQLRQKYVWLSAALAVLLASCGDGRLRVYPVRGQLLDSKKQPAAGALVVFHPQAANNLAKPLGRVGADGVFSLTTYQENDGAPAGDYVVTLEWPGDRKTPFDPEAPDRLGGRYRDAKQSQIRFTVEARDQNELPAIQLP